MLTEIYIENIALIPKMRLQFHKGLSVLTGETGAGKSILLDAMALMLGGKTDSELIRHNEEKALVEGVFCDLDDELLAKMQIFGIEGEELILTREIYPGRSICRINGRTFPLNVMKTFGERLVNIYGQHDFQMLLMPDNHLKLLDALVPEILETKKQVKECAGNILKIQNELTEINAHTQEIAKEADFLAFQSSEIDKAELTLGEEEDLLARQIFLANIEKITLCLSATYEILYGGRQTASEILAEAAKSTANLCGFDEKLAGFSTTLNDISAQNDDVAL
jgi:DNA repair protein RecN (Recombination protein N)